MEIPEIGTKMYVPGSMSISNGSSDTTGGLATIERFTKNDFLSEDHINYLFVSFKELPGHGFNYKVLVQDQEKLSKQYANKEAHLDPDIDTPWIEEGDFVNGAVYKGPPIY